VKRAVAALVMLGIGTVMATPSQAATTVYGSAQLKYTVNATASVSIATNYNTTTGAQQLTAPSILASAAGSCTAPAAETAATLTFAGITPPGTAGTYTGCLYQNALSIGILSNDSTGVNVFEYIDTPQTGEAVCMVPTDASLKAAPSASAATGTVAPYYTGTTCGAGVAKLLPGLGAATAGTGFGAAGNPGGTAVTATPTATTYTSGGIQLCGGATCTGNSGTTWKYMGQDIQLNVGTTAVSGSAANVITVAVIPA
jgi:hypothetical protein